MGYRLNWFVGTTDGGFLQYGFLDRIFINFSLNSGTAGVGLELLSLHLMAITS